MPNAKSAATHPSSAFIQHLFDRLARRYDIFNHLTSFGLAVRWRKAALEPIKQNMRVLDLGCGTGDLALEALKKVGPNGEVVGLDFSANMLTFARKRYDKLKSSLRENPRIRFVLKKAEELPFESEPYDWVVSGFVLRNLYKNIGSILLGVHRSLKPGGGISFLDITEPNSRFVKVLWKFYMNTVAAFYGKVLFGKDYPVLYLTESANRFLKKNEFMTKLAQSGFREVRTKSFMCGIIVLYQAVK